MAVKSPAKIEIKVTHGDHNFIMWAFFKCYIPSDFKYICYKILPQISSHTIYCDSQLCNWCLYLRSSVVIVLLFNVVK